MTDNSVLPWDNPRFRNWIALIRAERAVVRELTRALAPLDLKIGQLDVLMNILRHPGSSQHEVARKLFVGRSSITMLAPQLEGKGLISRIPDSNDKRVIRLHLTPDGEALLSKALRIYCDILDRVMAQSTTSECEALGEQMRRIEAALGGNDSDSSTRLA